MADNPTPEKIEELRAILRAAIPTLVPGVAAFLDAVQIYRDGGDLQATREATDRCADHLVMAALVANEAGWLDR